MNFTEWCQERGMSMAKRGDVFIEPRTQSDWECWQASHAQGRAEGAAVVEALIAVRDYYEQKVDDWEDCEACGNLFELCPEHGLMYALLMLTDPKQHADFTPYALREPIAKAAIVTYAALAAVDAAARSESE